MIDDKEFDFVSQNAHILGGAVAVFLPIVMFDTRALIGAVPSFLLFAAVKEFWWDNQFETPEVRGSNFRDFVFYCVGIVVALALWGVSHLWK